MVRRVLCGLLLASILCGCHLFAPHRRFDSAEWKRIDVAKNDAGRLAMVDDLLGRRILVGKNRSEAEQILGPPDKDAKGFAGWDFVYWLGPQRSMTPIDSEWLVVRFDRNGLVSTATDIPD